jgi:hypothetical protein
LDSSKNIYKLKKGKLLILVFYFYFIYCQEYCFFKGLIMKYLILKKSFYVFRVLIYI